MWNIEQLIISLECLEGMSVVLSMKYVLVCVLMPKHIWWPLGDQFQDVIEVLECKWGYPQCAGAIDKQPYCYSGTTRLPH